MHARFKPQKILIFGLALTLCAALVGPIQAAPQGVIQDMITAAADGGTVNIPAGTYSETLLVDKNLTLKGVSLADTILQSADAHHRVIKVTAGHNLRLEYLRVTGGHPDTPGDEAGGGVYLAGGSLTLDHVQIDHNQANYGGGVFQESAGGSVTTSNCLIDNNTASVSGGGVYSAGPVALSYTILQNNTASNHGGGLHANDSASLTGGSVSGNQAQNGNGGGVNVNNGLTVSGTLFTGNTAAGSGDIAGSGGAITQWNSGKTVTINGASFTGNTAQVRGGAVHIHESRLTLSYSNFTNNTVNSSIVDDDTYGGGVYAGGGLDGSNLVFTTNSAGCTGACFSLGGAVYIQMPITGASTVIHSTFTGNLAWMGSGIYSLSSVQLTLTDCGFISNGAILYGHPTSGYGGGVDAYWVHGDRLLFQDNKVINRGGGLEGRDIALTHTRFINNSAPAGGGGVYSLSSFTGSNLLFAGNTSGSGAALNANTGGTVTLYNATIARPAQAAGPALYLETSVTVNLYNSIVNNYTNAIQFEGSSTTMGSLTEDYNLFYNNIVDIVGGHYYPGGHSTGMVPPGFIDPAAGNYHLKPSSRAIGAGHDYGLLDDLDLRQRFSGRNDIGAYQFWASTFIPLVRK